MSAPPRSLNIVYINHYAGSPDLGMEYRPYFLAKQWGRSGHRTLIVAADHSHLRVRKPDAALDSSPEPRGVEYQWLTTPAYAGNGVRRVLNMLAFSFKVWWKAKEIVARKPDVVIASSTYTWDIFGARRIARLSGARLVFEVHDLWPLTPKLIGNMPSWHPFIVSLQWGEDVACRASDAVISILPHADRHLATRGMPLQKYSHVPNGIDETESEIDHSAVERIRSQVQVLRRTNSLVVGYAGGHGEANALDNLLDCARLLEGEGIHVLLIGKGSDKARLIQRCQAEGIDAVSFTDPVPKGSINAVLQLFDGLFIGWEPSPLYRFGIGANKLIDYMYAGRPIIHAFSERSCDPVATHRCGISVEADDPARLAEALRGLAAMTPEQRDAMGSRGHQAAVLHHTYPSLADRFLRAAFDEAQPEKALQP